MKYFSYANDNHNYTKAIELKGIRSIDICEDARKSAIRYSVRIAYADKTFEHFLSLTESEAKKVYDSLVNLLNKS